MMSFNSILLMPKYLYPAPIETTVLQSLTLFKHT